MMLLQLSAAQGPAECALAVAKALRCLLQEAKIAGVAVSVLEQQPGEHAGTWRSVLLALDGAKAATLAASWCGSVQWICTSPYRPRHGRKNWFIGVSTYAPPEPEVLGEIRFEACKASGPGGQHVNTTDSAVRAIHVASGISVKVQTERSQHANKKLAALLIVRKLAEQGEQANQQQRAERRMAHHEVERGNPVRIHKGEKFERL